MHRALAAVAVTATAFPRLPVVAAGAGVGFAGCQGCLGCRGGRGRRRVVDRGLEQQGGGGAVRVAVQAGARAVVVAVVL